MAPAVAVLLLGVSVVAPAGSRPAHQANGLNTVNGGPAAVQGLLVREFPTYRRDVAIEAVTIITRAGKRLPVPARVHEFPFGLSPDARLVAGVSLPDRLRGAGAVVLGLVRGGAMKTVLYGGCTSPPCPYGADPSYAWSRDSRRLAVAANPAHGATLLKLVDRDGHLVRSFTLPGSNPEQGGRAYHRIDSWSPDGSRLLLIRSGAFGPTAVVVLNVNTGRLWAWTSPREWGPGNSPQLAWSPDGRLIALTSTGTQDAPDVFAVIDVAAARAIILRFSGRDDLSEASTAPVWAPDGRSLFVSRLGDVGTRRVSSRIDRLYLDGRRVNLITSAAGWLKPRVALPAGLAYEAVHDKGSALYLYSFATRHSELLFSSRKGIDAVLPLAHIP